LSCRLRSIKGRDGKTEKRKGTGHGVNAVGGKSTSRENRRTILFSVFPGRSLRPARVTKQRVRQPDVKVGSTERGTDNKTGRTGRGWIESPSGRETLSHIGSGFSGGGGEAHRLGGNREIEKHMVANKAKEMKTLQSRNHWGKSPEAQLTK